jgi:hypothetical protein
MDQAAVLKHMLKSNLSMFYMPLILVQILFLHFYLNEMTQGWWSGSSGKHEALSPNPSAAKKKRKKRRTN